MEKNVLIGLDTNLLVRLIMRDDEKQFEKVRDFLIHLEKNKTVGFVNLVVLTELAFLLLRTYKLPKKIFVEIMFSLCHKTFILLEKETVVLKTLEVYKTLNVDFHDLLISTLNTEQKIKLTMSFDKKACAKIAEFNLL